MMPPSRSVLNLAKIVIEPPKSQNWSWHPTKKRNQLGKSNKREDDLAC